MYVDSHQHFWKLSRGDYSWMTPDMKVLYKDFFPEDLEPLIKDKNITQTVIVQAADSVAETEFTLSLASKHDFIAGVVGWVDLDSDKAKDDIDKLCESNFLKGFRPMIHDILDDEWMLKDNLGENESYDILGEYWLGELDNNIGSDLLGEVIFYRGVGAYMNHARNIFNANVFNIYHDG